MTTREKIDTIPKIVYVTPEQYGLDGERLALNGEGLADFRLDLHVHEDGAVLAYTHHCQGICHVLWDTLAYLDGETRPFARIGDCVEECLDRALEYFSARRKLFTSLDTRGGIERGEKGGGDE